MKYDHRSIQDKWNKRWQASKIYQPDLDNAKNPYYVLYMFPYPSAEGLHVGHAFSGTGADVYARFKRMNGLDVFHPMGFDAFGIHSENFALKINDHPQNLINRATKKFREQFDSLGISYDWAHSVNTSSPQYYKWTQWLFIQLFKAGLAEKKKAEVNWCPSCKTVLADEQVVAGKNVGMTSLNEHNRENETSRRVCERCGTEVEKKELEQWFFRITIYADKLLEGLSRIDWTEKVKLAQRNWIGKSEGLLFTAPVKDTKLHIDTFSAHFQAFYADTFVVIAPDHPRLPELLEGISNRREIEEFCKRLIEKRKTEKPGEEKEPEGIFTGRYIEDPIGNGNLPIWVANYAIKEYGTGIVKCSVHDERDFAFAKKYKLRLKPVLFPSDPKEKTRVQRLELCYTDMENGILSEPKEFSGKRAGDVTQQIIQHAIKKGFAKPVSHYHLRDWLISRQRYWGAPIPMIFCQSCADKGTIYSSSEQTESRSEKFSTGSNNNAMAGWFPVPEDQLPVLLPYIENFKPLGTGVAPLAQDEEFVNTKCPKCKGPAKRETDVADTFLDSSWYFLRYPSTDFEHKAFDEARNRRWLPVPMYIGGAEHSVLHLLYSRFVTKVLFDLKLIDFDEPFTKFRAHGLIIKDAAKMSKSRGNVVNPDEYVNKYGADTLRCYLMFLGPFDQGGDFRDSGIEGMERFLKRARKLVSDHVSRLKNQSSKSSDSFLSTPALEKVCAKAVKGVTDDVESLRYNTAIAKIMEFVNDLNISKDTLDPKCLKTLILLLAPFAPYLAEELWERLEVGKVSRVSKVSKGDSFFPSGTPDTSDTSLTSVHLQSWPKYDKTKLKQEEYKIAVQVNGKLRSVVSIEYSVSSKDEVEKRARKDPRVSKYIEGKQIQNIIYVEGRILNFVTTNG